MAINLHETANYNSSNNNDNDTALGVIQLQDAFNVNASVEEYNATESDYFDFILYQVTVPVLFGTITVVGALGNFLVIYVILSREKMRTVTNLLLLNLAFADLAFVLVVPPFTSYQMAAAWWPFGDVACRLMHYSVNVTAYVTVYTLVVIAVMRYLTIVHNATTTWFRTRRVTVGLIVSLWAILLAVNVPVLLSYETRPTKLSEDPATPADGPPDCDLVERAVGQRLFSTFFAFAYLVPLSAIAILSVRILTDIRRQRDAMSAGVQRTSGHRRKQAVGRTLALVVGLFAALWLPVHVHLLVWFFGTHPTGRWYQVVSVIWNCLAYSNSCVNPIIYNHTSKDFRDSFRAVVLSSCYGRRRREQNEETTVVASAVGGRRHKRAGSGGRNGRGAAAQLLLQVDDDVVPEMGLMASPMTRTAVGDRPDRCRQENGMREPLLSPPVAFNFDVASTHSSEIHNVNVAVDSPPMKADFDNCRVAGARSSFNSAGCAIMTAGVAERSAYDDVIDSDGCQAWSWREGKKQPVAPVCNKLPVENVPLTNVEDAFRFEISSVSVELAATSAPTMAGGNIDEIVGRRSVD